MVWLWSSHILFHERPFVCFMRIHAIKIPIHFSLGQGPHWVPYETTGRMGDQPTFYRMPPDIYVLGGGRPRPIIYRDRSCISEFVYIFDHICMYIIVCRDASIHIRYMFSNVFKYVYMYLHMYDFLNVCVCDDVYMTMCMSIISTNYISMTWHCLAPNESRPSSELMSFWGNDRDIDGTSTHHK